MTATPANYGSTSERGNIVDPEGDREDDAEVAYKPDLELERRMTASDIVKDPIIRKILVSYIFLAVVTVSIDAVWVLWLYMPISKGGVGFTVRRPHLSLCKMAPETPPNRRLKSASSCPL